MNHGRKERALPPKRAHGTAAASGMVAEHKVGQAGGHGNHLEEIFPDWFTFHSTIITFRAKWNGVSSGNLRATAWRGLKRTKAEKAIRADPRESLDAMRGMIRAMLARVYRQCENTANLQIILTCTEKDGF